MDEKDRKTFSDAYDDASPEAQDKIQAIFREYAVTWRDLTEAEAAEAGDRVAEILNQDQARRRGQRRSLTSMLRILRDEGWMVAVHNDYRLEKKFMTFWLFAHPSGRWLKGEADTDEAAVAIVFTALGRNPVY